MCTFWYVQFLCKKRADHDLFRSKSSALSITVLEVANGDVNRHQLNFTFYYRVNVSENILKRPSDRYVYHAPRTGTQLSRRPPGSPEVYPRRLLGTSHINSADFPLVLPRSGIGICAVTSRSSHEMRSFIVRFLPNNEHIHCRFVNGGYIRNKDMSTLIRDILYLQ